MAVYTPLANETIAAWLRAHYSLGPLRYAIGIAQGVENTNYLLGVGADDGAEEKKYILTVYEKRTQPQDLPFFLALLEHVAQQAIACPRPIARRDGTVLGLLGQKPREQKHAALFSFLPGQSRTQLEAVHCGAAGAALSALHRATANFSGTRENVLSLGGWQQIAARIAPRLNEIEPGLQALVEEELAFLTTHWPAMDALSRGIIHADLFPDNVFFIDDAVSGVIDFYFACDDGLAYDLAITINAWCFDGERLNDEKAHAMVASYHAARTLNAAERSAMPLLLRGAALRFLLTRAHDWLFHEKSALVTPKDPLEYAAKLRFHRQRDHAWLT